MQAIHTRYLTEVGTIHYLRRYWYDDHSCKQGRSYHNALQEIGRTPQIGDCTFGGLDADYNKAQYPTVCHYCQHTYGTAPGIVLEDCHLFHRRLYRTGEGQEVSWEDRVVGDLFVLKTDHDGAHVCHAGWTNCDGRHLHCLLPGGHLWDIDSRASNCTLKQDTTHRCWVRHGDPERRFPWGPEGAMRDGVIHVDKEGVTCAAGAGSIIVPGFHGFLHHGMLTDC